MTVVKRKLKCNRVDLCSTSDARSPVACWSRLHFLLDIPEDRMLNYWICFSDEPVEDTLQLQMVIGSCKVFIDRSRSYTATYPKLQEWIAQYGRREIKGSVTTYTVWVWFEYEKKQGGNT